ncbi:MAG: S-layer homology domain-containing protein [Clostridiales Family XIII bacterium]|nr:S-layer homology domain-containing protein [Clostridiales Family XIII bacterium]
MYSENIENIDERLDWFTDAAEEWGEPSYVFVDETQFGSRGSGYLKDAIAALLLEGWTTEDIVIEAVFEEKTTSTFAVTVISGEDENGSASVFNVDGNTYAFTAAPAYGYGLDHWEYKGASTSDSWQSAEDSYGKSNYTVTISEDREYKAVFAPRFKDVISAHLSEFAADSGADTPASIAQGYHIIGMGNPPASARINEGMPAALILKYKTLHHIYTSDVGRRPQHSDYPTLGLSLRVYAGESADDEKLIWSKAFTGDWGVIDGSQIALIVPEMPYTEKITVVYETGGEDQAYHVIDTRTFDISEYMVFDALKDKRLELSAAFDEYYAETFGQNPPGAENLPDETYKSFADVRYLLRDAYDKGTQSIKFGAAEDDTELTALYDAAVARFTALAALQTKINEGDGEYYKSVPGVMKAAVASGGNIYPFAYVPMLGPDKPTYLQGVGDNQNNALTPLCAALEAAYPGVWHIGGGSITNIYITSISSTGGDGAVGSGPPSGNIVYAADNIWATLGFSQYPVSDRSVIRIGGALAANQVPPLGTGLDPNKDSLIWALAAVHEAGGEPTEAQTQAVADAQAMVSGWLPTETVTQTTADAALAALAKAFPDVNLARYDLPQEVQTVMNLITAIGSITPESGTAIAAARDAYNALESDELRNQVPNYATLTAAEEAFALLTAARPAYAEALGDVTAENLVKLNLTVGSMGGEWALLAAVRAGAAAPGSAFADGYLSSLNKLLNDGGLDGVTTTTYTDFARITLALSSLGIDASSYTAAGKTYNIVEKLTDYNKVVSQGINGPVFALLALDSKPCIPENTEIRDRYTDYILAKEISGGGFALSGDKADPDITAMTLQALAKYRDRPEVAAAATRGLAALKSLQDTTFGGFHSWGQYNSESAAQTVVALTALGIDPDGDAWTVNGSAGPLTALLAFYDAPSHGFRHALNGGVDQMATEQAACALAAYDRFEKGQNALYDMSDAFGGTSAGVDKSALQSVIATARSLNASDFTPDTWDALQTALAAADEVSADAAAAQGRVNNARSALLAAIGNLVTAEPPAPGVNAERLTAALETAGALTEADCAAYTEASRNALQSALAAARGVDAERAEQADINAAAETLLDALVSLTPRDIVDTTLLDAAVAAQTGLAQTDYTPATWTVYDNALTHAREEQPRATQQNADFAAQSLIASLRDLTKAAENGVDYTAVTAVLTEIKTTVSAVAAGRYTEASLKALAGATEKEAIADALCFLTLKSPPLNTALLEAAADAALRLTANLYTPDTWEPLALALVSAQTKQKQGIYTEQSAIDADARSILEAVKALAPAQNVGGANKTLLNLYVTQAELLNPQGYSTETWQTLQDALTAARTVSEDPEATQAAVDAARKALIDAIAALVKVIDRTALNAAMAEARAIMNKGYTNDSWKYLTDAIAAAKAVQDDEYASQALVDGAANDLLLAIAGLAYPEAPPATGFDPDGKTISVRFRLIGATLSNKLDEDDPLSSAIDLGDAHGYRGSEYKTWIATRSCTLNEGATVYDLFTQAINGAGLTQVGANKNYVKTIKAPAYYGGYALSEFTNGQRSGWMYTIGGRHPGYGLMEQGLADGDSVIWHYVNDYAYEVSDWFADAQYPSLATSAKFYNKWLEAEDVDPPRDGTYTPPAAAETVTDVDASAGGGASGFEVVAQKTVDTASAKPDANGKATVTVETAKVAEAVAEAVKAVEEAKAGGKTNAVAEIIIPIKTEGDAAVKTAEADIPAEAIKAIADAKDLILTVKSDVSTVTLDAKSVAGLAAEAKAGETVRIVTEAVETAEALNARQQEKVGDNPVIDLAIYIGDTVVRDFKGTATVSVPYEPPVDLSADDNDLLTVYYLDDDGNISEMNGARYDAKTGQITFTTTHFSKFFVSEWISPFGDIKRSDWFYKAARFSYSNGLISGVTENTFAPQTKLSRAMLITILAREAGTRTDGGATWYAKATEWGVENGITDGTNMTDDVTREQFAAILYRYAKLKGGEAGAAAGSAGSLSGFADAESVSDWALDAMAWAADKGLIAGRTETELAPAGTATRAEAATLLQRYIENIAS